MQYHILRLKFVQALFSSPFFQLPFLKKACHANESVLIYVQSLIVEYI